MKPRAHLALLALLLACSGGETKGTDTEVTLSASSTSASSSTTDATTSTAATATESTSTGTSSTGSTTAAGTGTDSATVGTTAGTTAGGECVPKECAGKIYQCGDCMDNDGDGKVDLADVECVSPCDDREDAFATGLPGDNMDPCKQDCFFDGNSGGGKGDCAWNLACDPMNPGGDKCPYDPNATCPDMQDPECLMNCAVPNGCDCFGCCTVELGGMSYDIYLGDADCNLADIQSCSTCTKNDQCDDDCNPDNCEVCFGQTEPPPGCEDPMCENGMDSCTIDNMGNDNCPLGTYCSTGCCWPIPG